MTKEEFIAKLQMVYVGDRNAFNELVTVYDNLQQRIDKAIKIAYKYAQIDGNHHKMWVIDQMLRKLLGNEYDKFVKKYEEDGKYTWDIGIAL